MTRIYIPSAAVVYQYPFETSATQQTWDGTQMSIEENKAIVGRWFTEFWGKDFTRRSSTTSPHPTSASSTPCTPPAAAATPPRPCRVPLLSFGGTADLIAEGDYVVGQWEGGGTHTGPAFGDLPIGSPGRQLRQDDALHRHDHPQGRERPDHRGGRPGAAFIALLQQQAGAIRYHLEPGVRAVVVDGLVAL